MIDLLDNDIHVGDKVIFPVGLYRHKELDYGIVKKISKSGKSCWCQSFRYDRFPLVSRKSYQVVKIS